MEPAIVLTGATDGGRISRIFNMISDGDKTEATERIDTSIIRPEMRVGEVHERAEGMEPNRLRKIRKTLRFLHKLELMAIGIYRYQISSKRPELNKHLIPAMCNEMTHFQDFQVKLFEHGCAPSRLRWMQWMAGMIIGIVSSLCGTKTILKCNIWLENKAICAYTEFIEDIDWDDQTRKIVEKDRADEMAHANRWKELLEQHNSGA